MTQKYTQVLDLLQQANVADAAHLAQAIDDIYYEGLWITEGTAKRRATMVDIVTIANQVNREAV